MITLPIKRQWFDRYMGNPVQVKFRNGYRKDSQSVVCTVVPHRGAGRPEWGAEPGKSYIVLCILEVSQNKL